MCIGSMGFEIASTFKPGTTEWDFRTFGTGQGFMADCIIAGILISRNGVSWLNLDNGTFDFANGNLAFDGTNLQMIGKIINVLNGYGVELDRGGITFATNGEMVGGIRSSRFDDDTRINGMSIVNTKDGDFMDLGLTDSEDFTGNVSFSPIIRISKIIHELMGNFKGIQLLENTRVKNGKTLYFQCDDPVIMHELYNTVSNHIAIIGDKGVMLGYNADGTRINAIVIDDAPNAQGNQVFIQKPLSMENNTIKFVPDIFTGNTGYRYLHEGWVGSIEKTAKRISNLNVYYDSGWYAYSTGSQGAPSGYGVVLHLKWGESDFVQLAMDFANNMYQRAWVNGAWTSWKTR